jgi:hypothetical protein
MNLVKLAIIYFCIVFGAGFLFGTVRVLVLVPQLGDRVSELMEMPLMLVAIVLAARWLQQWHDGDRPLTLLWVGLWALGLLLAAEIGVGVALRGLSPVEALVNRDPVSGTVYYLLLIVFALMPWLLSRR